MLKNSIIILVLAVLLMIAAQAGIISRIPYMTGLFLGKASHPPILSQLNDNTNSVRLPGIDEASGLTINQNSGSAFLVMNDPAQIIELNRHGTIIRKIALQGAGDLEGIEWINGNRFVVAEERRQRLTLVTLDEEVSTLDINQFPSFEMAINPNGNKNFEGLAYDPVHDRLYIAKERDPARLYVIDGFSNIEKHSGALSLRDLDDWTGLNHYFLADFSGLHFDRRTGHLLILSDQSRYVVELNQEGKAVSYLDLAWISNMKLPGISQAEGIVTDKNGSLYLVSEPNQLFVFTPEQRHILAENQPQKAHDPG